MTEALFREDAYLTTCAATVVGHGEGGVLLDRTVFYPTGGGQPGDAGTLSWAGGRCTVATAVKAPDGTGVLHVAAEGEALPPVGAAVTAEIDAATRALHRRVHTALHLLSVVIPLPVTGGAIGAGKGRLDFDMAEPPSDPAALERALNDLIAADRPVSDEWITDAELEANPGLVKTMAVKPPVGQGRVRLVRIGLGADTVDLQPCGGTHVRRSGEIGPVRLGKIEKKGRQNRRVTLLLADAAG
jgi:misacylated tRNA(Ala) deacylase